MHQTLSSEQLDQLSSCGYLSLSFDQFPALHESFSRLFGQTQQYFALDAQSEAKHDYRAPTGPGASEEGYSVIPGEKQIFTCRGYTRTPPIMRDHAKDVWDRTGTILQGIIRSIASSLQLPETVFDPFLGDCLQFQPKRTPSLLRLFRYDRPISSSANRESQDTSSMSEKVVAERHKDLGLLSIVVGSTPGLEVCNESTGEWISIEENDASKTRTDLCITLLAGQTLRFLTRGQYRAGIHRVKCAARTRNDGSSDPYRYSIVFALRPFPSTVNLHEFENDKIGRFTEGERNGIDGQSAQVLFSKLMNAHWNVNISQDIREQQRSAISVVKSDPQTSTSRHSASTNSQHHAKSNIDMPDINEKRSDRGWRRKWNSLKSRFVSDNAIHSSRVV